MLSLEDPTSLKSFLPSDSMFLELVRARKLGFVVTLCFIKSRTRRASRTDPAPPQHHIENSVVTH